MKRIHKYTFLLMIVTTSCTTLQIPNPQNWNSDILMQKMHSQEEQRNAQAYSERISTVKNDTITITAPY